MRSRSRFSPTASRSATPRPRTRSPAPGPGDRSTERESRQRVAPGGHSLPTRSTTRRPAGRVGLLHSDDPQLSRLARHHQRRQPPGCADRPFRPDRTLPTAAVIGGFAINPLVTAAAPEFGTAIAHLRDVLREATYESLARKAETMTTAEIVTLRIRPNRPGPSRTERRLEIDHIRDGRSIGPGIAISAGRPVSQVRLEITRTLSFSTANRSAGSPRRRESAPPRCRRRHRR